MAWAQLLSSIEKESLQGIMRGGPAFDADYKKQLGKSFLREAEENITVTWIKNDCNRRVARPHDSCFTKQSRAGLAGGTRPEQLTTYLINLWVADTDHDGPAAAITIVNLVTDHNHHGRQSKIFATSGTNRRSNGGQVHAEYISTRIAADVATEWAHEQGRTPVVAKFYTLTSKVTKKKKSSKYNENSFAPCDSCKQTLAAIIKRVRDKGNAEVTQHGDAIVNL